MCMGQIYCDVPDCGKPHKARGFCRYHYTNFLRHGDPLKTKTMRRSPGTRTIEDKRASRRADYRKNTERYKANARDFYEKNKPKRMEQSKQWKIDNKARYDVLNRVHASKRNAKKKMATPPWLTELHWEQIKVIYAEAVRLTKETGIPHEVDHIVPLSGKTVSGLHVPWNLRAIPAVENNRRPRIWDHNTQI
jgi:5-methylcytosine-specific restriction endonuclease McrA